MVKRRSTLLCLVGILFLFLLLTEGLTLSAESEVYVKEITVKRGDNLYRICHNHCGNFSRELRLRIHLYNPSLKSSDIIREGEVLRLPCNRSIPVSLPIPQPSYRPPSHHLPQPSVAVPASVSPPEPQPSSIPASRSEPMSPPGSTTYKPYPAGMQGEILKLEWTTDNTAIVSGKLRMSGKTVTPKLIVSVPGDLDYEQPFSIKDDGSFESVVCIGRPGQDYGKEFILRLMRFEYDRAVTEFSYEVVKQKDVSGTVLLTKRDQVARFSGIKGFDKWVETQTVSTDRIDNKDFKVKDGLAVKNYRYMEYSPDERYLSRFGRITLYGSATIAKALVLLKGDTEKAKRIVNVWLAQMDAWGGMPRSANIIGDNYISIDVRSGDMAHLLGALALIKAASNTREYDDAILRISKTYFSNLQDKQTGLVRGGYDLDGRGLSNPGKIQPVMWASAEHNFDIFQAFLLLSRIFPGEDGIFFRNFARNVGAGLDGFMWDKEAGTFNRGYRFEAGYDRARALDCSSWGTLYLVKQARLAREERNENREDVYIRRAERAMNFIENNFVVQWCYEAQDNSRDCISGYKPYAGRIDDVMIESTKRVIDWDLMNTMVWSEGTLGAAMAYSELCTITKNAQYCANFNRLVGEILKLQSLSDKGGVLYSSERLEGHFTRGEELASMAWLGYALAKKENRLNPLLKEYRDWIPW